MSEELQAAKAVVLAFNEALDTAGPGGTLRAVSPLLEGSYKMLGMHPFNTMEGVEAVTGAYWEPLKAAFGTWQRRPDIFMAGMNILPPRDDREPGPWVVEMGHLVGLFDRDWLGIAATGKPAFLRYCDFHRVAGGRIAETACYTDIVGIMHQAGIDPFNGQTGASIISPGPKTHDGLLHEAQNPDEGRKTADLISAMVEDLVGEGVASPDTHLANFWTEDMNWFGPAGIGASGITHEGYIRGHTRPFEEGLEFIRHNGHQCRMGEGNFGGFFGYPSLTMKNRGGYLRMPASDKEADMRIIDLYRRDGDKLAENWIFIDLLHFAKMQGRDVLAEISAG